MKRKVLNYEKGTIPFINDLYLEKVRKFEENSSILKNNKIKDINIWNVARKEERVPNFNEIYYSLLFEKAIKLYLENLKSIKSNNFLINIKAIRFVYYDDTNNKMYDLVSDYFDFENTFR